MKARFTSQAETELAAAIDYYESQQIGLGADFLLEVNDAERRIEHVSNGLDAYVSTNPQMSNTPLPVRIGLSIADK